MEADTGRTTTSGHPRAAELERFLAEHYARVVGSVALITGDRASAEDAVQDALVKAWRRRDQHLDRLAAWVTVVASNEARSRGRRRAAEARALARAGTDPVVTPPEASGSGAGGPGTGAVGSGIVDPELERALAGLPRRERQAAVLHYVLDMSVADVAATLQISAGSVKTLLSRARNHLAAALGGPAAATAGGVA